MLSLPPSVKVFLCAKPTDMRRSFDGLAAMTEAVLKQDPFSGHLFVFRNRRGDRLKVLYWDRGGYAIWYKRLEEGLFLARQRRPDIRPRQTFGRMPDCDGDSAELDASDLALILDGLDLDVAERRPRFKPRRA